MAQLLIAGRPTPRIGLLYDLPKPPSTAPPSPHAPEHPGGLAGVGRLGNSLASYRSREVAKPQETRRKPAKKEWSGCHIRHHRRHLPAGETGPYIRDLFHLLVINNKRDEAPERPCASPAHPPRTARSPAYLSASPCRAPSVILPRCASLHPSVGMLHPHVE